MVNVSTLKPLDRQAVTDLAKGARFVVTAEALRGERMPIEFVGIQDRFGTSARGYEE